MQTHTGPLAGPSKPLTYGQAKVQASPLRIPEPGPQSTAPAPAQALLAFALGLFVNYSQVLSTLPRCQKHGSS